MPKKLSRLFKSCRRGSKPTVDTDGAEKSSRISYRTRWRFWRKTVKKGNNDPLVSVIEDHEQEDDVHHDDQHEKKELEVVEMKLSKTCKLCLTDVPVEDIRVMMACGCFFCQQCLRQYVTHQVAQGDVDVGCPDGQCPRKGRFLLEELDALMDADTHRKFLRFKLNREVETDPGRVWCPRPGCERVIRLERGCVKSTARAVACPSCYYRFCCACSAPVHGDRSCADSLRPISSTGDGIPMSSELDAPIKRCPSCQVPIERDDGCAQMMCRRCKHVFCWYCLASLDDDFLLRHFDDGPCKNRLGHSRGLVIWHRVQVIGIFAGFGVLLLVASPLLLIAAPCILCCRTCKSGSYEDQEPSAEGPSTSCA